MKLIIPFTEKEFTLQTPNTISIYPMLIIYLHPEINQMNQNTQRNKNEFPQKNKQMLKFMNYLIAERGNYRKSTDTLLHPASSKHKLL